MGTALFGPRILGSDSASWASTWFLRSWQSLSFILPCLCLQGALAFHLPLVERGLRVQRLAVSYFPDPFFRIYVNSIHKAKHGSDSGVFDSYGRFTPSRFEDIWAEVRPSCFVRQGLEIFFFFQFARRGATEAPRTKMTLSELWEFVSANRVAMDPFGWFASVFEWLATFLLVQKKGEVYKDDVRKIMDGSLFFEIREARQTKGGWNKGWGLGGDGFIGDEKVFYFGSGQ